MYVFSDDNKYYRIVHASIIVLGVFTCGTSVLLWWLYKSLVVCSNKDKYDVEGNYIYVHTYVYRNIITCVAI